MRFFFSKRADGIWTIIIEQYVNAQEIGQNQTICINEMSSLYWSIWSKQVACPALMMIPAETVSKLGAVLPECHLQLLPVNLCHSSTFARLLLLRRLQQGGAEEEVGFGEEVPQTKTLWGVLCVALAVLNLAHKHKTLLKSQKWPQNKQTKLDRPESKIICDYLNFFWENLCIWFPHLFVICIPIMFIIGNSYFRMICCYHLLVESEGWCRFNNIEIPPMSDSTGFFGGGGDCPPPAPEVKKREE